MSAREDILARVRQAVRSQPSPVAPTVVRGYRRAGTSPMAELLDLFQHRLLEYRADVRRCPPAEVDAVVAAALLGRGVSRLVVPAGLGIAWPPEVETVADDGPLTPDELDACDGVVTLAAVAIAETGTVVLDGSRGQGRRALSLVPDYHLCIVYADQLVETVPEAVSVLRPERPLTWISGPSATSDIELNRVEGVHGPRTLEVVLVSG